MHNQYILTIYRLPKRIGDLYLWVPVVDKLKIRTSDKCLGTTKINDFSEIIQFYQWKKFPKASVRTETRTYGTDSSGSILSALHFMDLQYA